MKDHKKAFNHLLILTDLGKVRVLNFEAAGDDPSKRAHLTELSDNQLSPPTGAATTDGPGRFSRGFAAGNADALSHAETKLDIEVEKRAISQVAKEICGVISHLGCHDLVLAAPQEHLKRLEADMDANSRAKVRKFVGADLTNSSLKDLEKRFL